MFWLLSGIYFYTERYSLTALLVSRKMFSPYSMWHCNATRQKQGKRERMSMCASVCVGFFFYIQQMFALLYILRRSDKRCKERSCWRKNKRFVERVFRHAQWSFKVYPLSQYFFLFPVLYKWITVHLSSLNQPPSFQCSFQCNLQVWVVFSQV